MRIIKKGTLFKNRQRMVWAPEMSAEQLADIPFSNEMVFTRQMLRDLITFTGAAGISPQALLVLCKEKGVKLNIGHLNELIEQGAIAYDTASDRFYGLLEI